MSLYAISDLHLSLSSDKPMDVFRGWENYVERLKANWTRLIKDSDTVVIPGDIRGNQRRFRVFKLSSRQKDNTQRQSRFVVVNLKKTNAVFGRKQLFYHFFCF